MHDKPQLRSASLIRQTVLFGGSRAWLVETESQYQVYQSSPRRQGPNARKRQNPRRVKPPINSAASLDYTGRDAVERMKDEG
jgi:hypothetical protein